MIDKKNNKIYKKSMQIKSKIFHLRETTKFAIENCAFSNILMN